jgi:hypothetical protein
MVILTGGPERLGKADRGDGAPRGVNDLGPSDQGIARDCERPPVKERRNHLSHEELD